MDAQKVDCDRHRQELRECLTALKKSPQSSVWLARPGGVTIKATITQAKAIIEQGMRILVLGFIQAGALS